MSRCPNAGKLSQITESITIPHGVIPGSYEEAVALTILLERTAYSTDAQTGHWINIHSKVLEREMGKGYRPGPRRPSAA